VETNTITPQPSKTLHSTEPRVKNMRTKDWNHQDPRSREPRVNNQDPKSQEPRAKCQEPRAKNRDPKNQ
jgi:hypothetical protein